ncbi:MAG: hypothetical protein LAT82_00005, partial [Nanoarchaeota archaeon]|nr:hypothetical protein [Nanoarchaeota archaeon]
NKAGDTMSGNLNVQADIISNRIRTNEYCDSTGDDCFSVNDFLTGDTPIFSNNLQHGWPDVIECNLQIQRYTRDFSFSPPKEIKLYLHFSHEDFIGGGMFGGGSLIQVMTYTLNSDRTPAYLNSVPTFQFNSLNGNIVGNYRFSHTYRTSIIGDNTNTVYHTSDCEGQDIEWFIENNKAFDLYNKVSFDNFNPSGPEPIPK